MKIAVLMDAPLRATLLSEKTMARLAEWGEVAVNETDKAEKETVKQIIAGADIAITSWGVPQLDKEILDCAPNLRFVAHAAGSVKGIVSDELYARGIRVVSSARILSYGVLGNGAGPYHLRLQKRVCFQRGDPQRRLGGGLQRHHRAVRHHRGRVGCGFAGSHYIELLQAFGVNVLAYDPLLDEAAIAAMGAKKADLDTLLAESDVVSLHAPALDSTRHMINGRALSLMKDRAILINTARGALVDEEALAQALRGGKLKYACLDVTDPEPPAADSPLRGIPNCIMTPHLAGLANNGKLKIGAHVADEIGRFLTGGALVSEITQAMAGHHRVSAHGTCR